jgi:hypothetical protein
MSPGTGLAIFAISVCFIFVSVIAKVLAKFLGRHQPTPDTEAFLNGRFWPYLMIGRLWPLWVLIAFVSGLYSATR